MPEEPEIDADQLNERIHEELEHEGGALLKTSALTTALFAALGAIAALLAGGTVNEALVLKTEATRLQAEASDQWTAIRGRPNSRVTRGHLETNALNFARLFGMDIMAGPKTLVFGQRQGPVKKPM
jgi:hypothetical protein